MERITKFGNVDSTQKRVSVGLYTFLLVLATLFAILFLVSYSQGIILRKRVERYGKVLKAYELYLRGDSEFETFVKENELKEVSWLLPKFNLFAVRKSLDEAKAAFERGNFADVVSTLSKVKDVDSPWNDEVFYLLGTAHARIGQTEQAKFYLTYFVNGFEGSIYRKSALTLLRDLSEGEDKKKIEDILKKLQ
ncbi:tetratricopeptide repeat protein [Fervidobacterium thailandense]|uniref:Tetratricopeptide repeat protein n=1 Tax=Fervidobacterium thailandense TaxID=1008305 RepID=A0A1E3G4J1_9BACT|nr:hypothetical protein [Fervidobacterium thailandense]ODN31211.1 hypothetical protein A4H02_00020 [Fervidobacterium thailandense]